MSEERNRELGYVADRGICSSYPGVTSATFYPGEHGSSSRNNRTRVRKQAIAAKTVCAECPVRVECLTYALSWNERYGIWGGKTRYERVAIRRYILGVRSTSVSKDVREVIKKYMTSEGEKY